MSRWPAGVRIVFLDMEEIGLVGSRASRQSLDAADVAAMINVEVVGYSDTLLYGPQATSPGHRLQQACAPRDTCVGTPGMPSDDDCSFLQAGISTVSLNGPHEGMRHEIRMCGGAGFPDSQRSVEATMDSTRRLGGRGASRVGP